MKLRRSARREHQQQRPEQVELLLDAERPQMQQRLFGEFDVEIAGLATARYWRRTRRWQSVAAELRKGPGSIQNQPRANVQQSTTISAGKMRRIRRL